MKALVKIAPIVVILACIASLVFAFKLSGIKTGLLADKAQLTEDLGKTRTDLTQTRKDLDTRTAQLKQSQNETVEVKANLDATKVTLEAKSKQVDDLTTRTAAAEQQATDAKTKLAAADKKVEELAAELDKPEFKNAKKTAEDLENMKSENKVLGEQLASEKAKTVQLAKDLEEERRTPLGVRGKVVVSKDDWGFVVLNVGNAEHVRANTNFLLYRDSKLVAKARVTLVRPTTCVAELVSGFTKFMPRAGDSAVVQQGKM
jgi:septal ring factor EnvC (AmiA/AmiB activator)